MEGSRPGCRGGWGQPPSSHEFLTFSYAAPKIQYRQVRRKARHEEHRDVPAISSPGLDLLDERLPFCLLEHEVARFESTEGAIVTCGGVVLDLDRLSGDQIVGIDVRSFEFAIFLTI